MCNLQKTQVLTIFLLLKFVLFYAIQKQLICIRAVLDIRDSKSARNINSHIFCNEFT